MHVFAALNGGNYSLLWEYFFVGLVAKIPLRLVGECIFILFRKQRSGYM